MSHGETRTQPVVQQETSLVAAAHDVQRVLVGQFGIQAVGGVTSAQTVPPLVHALQPPGDALPAMQAARRVDEADQAARIVDLVVVITVVRFQPAHGLHPPRPRSLRR